MRLLGTATLKRRIVRVDRLDSLVDLLNPLLMLMLLPPTLRRVGLYFDVPVEWDEVAALMRDACQVARGPGR